MLQTRSNTSCPMDEAPDNSLLRLIAFVSKSLSGAVKRYSKIEREALRILYRPKKINHYFFTREVSITTNHKLLVAIFNKDMAILSHRLQNFFIADQLSRQNYNEKQRCKGAVKHQCNADSYQHTRMHSNT